MEKNPVPVIMHHSIGIPNNNWQWNYLTCGYKKFESQLKWLKKKQFNTISLKQLYEFMKNGSKLPKNPIILSFDDGYLDNWTFAYPLLKKYGFKGTLYVNPEFVDPRPILRTNLEKVWEGEIQAQDLDNMGYLSWKELNKMENKGIMDVQSHSMSHTWYPSNEKIIDFRHPGDSYIWMTWNQNVKQKYLLQKDDPQLVRYAEPVYEFGRSIGVRKYVPDESLSDYIVEYVQENGGNDYFSHKNWKSKLHEISDYYKKDKCASGRYETNDEYQKRLFYELDQSKGLIEKKLDKEVEFLCWPGGAVTKDALEIATETGYLSSTVGKDIAGRDKLKNIYGEDPTRINRFGTALYWDGIEGYGSKIKYQNGFYLSLTINRYMGNKFSTIYLFIFYLGSRLSKYFLIVK